MFEKDVKTPNGNTKHIVADSQTDLDASVKAAQAEPKMASPDIDNPDHGNMTTAEFQAYDGKRKQANDAEATPTSEESKTLSKKLATADGDRAKMGEIMDQDSQEKQSDDESNDKAAPAPKSTDSKQDVVKDDKTVDSSKKS